jgi:hypothetical protein
MDGFDPGTAEASITRALGIADGVRRRSAANAPRPDRMATGATCMVTAVTAGLSATLPTRVAADDRADPRTRREVAADRAAGGHHNGVDGEDACPPDIQGSTVAGCGTGIPRAAAAPGAAEAGSRGDLGAGPTARSSRPGHPHQQRHGRSSTTAAINAATTVRRRPHPIRLRRSAPPTGPALTARGLASASSAAGTHPRVAVEGPPPRFAAGIRATPAATMVPPRGRRTAGIRRQLPSPAAGAILGKIGGRDGCGVAAYCPLRSDQVETEMGQFVQATWASGLWLLLSGGSGLRTDCCSTVSMGYRRLYSIIRVVLIVQESENKMSLFNSG